MHDSIHLSFRKTEKRIKHRPNGYWSQMIHHPSDASLHVNAYLWELQTEELLDSGCQPTHLFSTITPHRKTDLIFFPLLFVWGAFIHGCITPALQLHKCSQKVTLSHHRQRGSELDPHSSPDSHKHSVFSPEWTANNSHIDQIGLLFTRGSDWSTYSMYWMTHWPS